MTNELETNRPNTLGILDCGTCGRTHYWCNCGSLELRTNPDYQPSK